MFRLWTFRRGHWSVALESSLIAELELAEDDQLAGGAVCTAILPKGQRPSLS